MFRPSPDCLSRRHADWVSELMPRPGKDRGRWQGSENLLRLQKSWRNEER
jgi:hypothetical protein